ncbi:MAG: EF-P beta-lysylation protein EpmB [Gammaproteobacteria bacterium]|nr:EF-P beta-lysylation protein EpmB [Gammaproteobacteria bacterium]
MPKHPFDDDQFALPWQQQLSAAFNSVNDLCRYLEINPSDLPISSEACRNFPLRVPLSFAASMAKGDANDPLLRQVLPINDELIDFPGYKHDPVGDLAASVMPGLLHKYHGRVLLITTGACAINCRYCFRRSFPYQKQQLSKQQEQNVLDYIQANNTISEVILSGGDPLILSDARLGQLIGKLAALQQIKRIRIHSRLPIVLPARITDDLIDLLMNCSKQVVLVVHCNHAKEINEHVINALNLLKNKNITLLNQAVLLKGINDNANTLCDLSETLFANGIMPYYLHLLDKASGTGHFDIPEEEAKALISQVQNRLPGYLVPKLVKEVAGEKAKQYV